MVNPAFGNAFGNPKLEKISFEEGYSAAENASPSAPKHHQLPQKTD